MPLGTLDTALANYCMLVNKVDERVPPLDTLDTALASYCMLVNKVDEHVLPPSPEAYWVVANGPLLCFPASYGQNSARWMLPQLRRYHFSSFPLLLK